MKNELGKTEDGREFPMYNGELLCWSPGSYQTPAEELIGFPRMRTVYRAIIANRPQQLAYERRELLKGSFDRMFGHNCRKALTILEEEMAQ